MATAPTVSCVVPSSHLVILTASISIPFDPEAAAAMEIPIASATHLLEEIQPVQSESSEVVSALSGTPNGLDTVSASTNSFVSCVH